MTPDGLDPAAHPLERLPEEWAETLAAWGEPRYRAGQVFRWMHARGVLDPDAMSDLPKALRARLSDELDAAGGVPRVAERHDSDDGTRKLVLALGDGRRVETVLIPRASGSPWDDGAHEAVAGEVSQCVSSQVGCAMGCVFCASGVNGLDRHLSAAEIVAQVALRHAGLDDGERVSQLVFMGMGEPLHNYGNLRRALALLTHPEGLGLSPRRVTVSTSGLVPQIDRLAADFGGKVALAISLHAATDGTRSRILPVNKKYPLAKLLDALRRYPLPPRRQLTVEYTLLRGVNDAPRDADALVRALRGLRAKVNLIPMNPVEGVDLEAPAEPIVRAFQDRLRRGRVPVFVRKQRGDDIAAACGQLALRENLRRRGRRPKGLAVIPDTPGA